MTHTHTKSKYQVIARSSQKADSQVWSLNGRGENENTFYQHSLHRYFWYKYKTDCQAAQQGNDTFQVPRKVLRFNSVVPARSPRDMSAA